ncbi:MAG: polysaccharide deacetylase family protein [Geobacteraceae bacterium]
MKAIRSVILGMVFFVSCLPLPAVSAPLPATVRSGFQVPILLYHRFGPTVTDSMTVTDKVFESQLSFLRTNGYRVIPLQRLVNSYLGKAPAPPRSSVVIVADDGHLSVYTDMQPLVKKYKVPVTLFIYPSAISNAKYAMTWQQLRELKKGGLFDIQSHTYWHPNFGKEKKKLKPAEYDRFVDLQFRKSKEKLEKELGGPVDMLAWPFGLPPDRSLVEKAERDGYKVGFTIVRHPVSSMDTPMLLPRFLIVNADQGMRFARILETNREGSGSAQASSGSKLNPKSPVLARKGNSVCLPAGSSLLKSHSRRSSKAPWRS